MLVATSCQTSQADHAPPLRFAWERHALGVEFVAPTVLPRTMDAETIRDEEILWVLELQVKFLLHTHSATCKSNLHIPTPIHYDVRVCDAGFAMHRLMLESERVWLTWDGASHTTFSAVVHRYQSWTLLQARVPRRLCWPLV